MKAGDISSTNDSGTGTKVLSWVAIARLQFFPMAFIAYSMGAVAAFKTKGGFNVPVYLIGYAALFLIELCTIMVNEYHDYESDRINRNYSMFTGGSRVLVDGKLTFREVRIGIGIVLFLAILVGYLLLIIDRSASSSVIIGLLLAGIALGLGYTMPPIKFSHRGFGEVVVGVTHTFFLVICGYSFQAGAWGGSLPWVLSIPLFFAVLAAIVLAGVPDRLADKAAAKRTIAVILGPKKAVLLAECFVVAAAVSALLVYRLGIDRWALIVEACLITLHGVALPGLLFMLLRSEDFDRRIDRVIGSALSYILWFGLIPLLSML